MILLNCFFLYSLLNLTSSDIQWWQAQRSVQLKDHSQKFPAVGITREKEAAVGSACRRRKEDDRRGVGLTCSVMCGSEQDPPACRPLHINPPSGELIPTALITMNNSEHFLKVLSIEKKGGSCLVSNDRLLFNLHFRNIFSFF